MRASNRLTQIIGDALAVNRVFLKPGQLGLIMTEIEKSLNCVDVGMDNRYPVESVKEIEERRSAFDDKEAAYFAASEHLEPRVKRITVVKEQFYTTVRRTLSFITFKDTNT